MMPKQRMLLIGVLPESLINFRGHLIRALQQSDLDVLAVSDFASEQTQQAFEQAGIRHQGVPFQRNGLNPFADVASLRALLRLFKQEKPSFVLAYTIKPVIWGGFAARLAGVRFFALITGLGYAFQGKGFRRKLLMSLVVFLYRNALARSVAVIFQNEDNREIFVSLGIVPRDKTFVVNGSGVDINRFSLKPLPSVENPITFLCIARLLGEKGLREYANAAALVKKCYPQARFVLVGPEDSSPDGISLAEVQQWDAIDYQGGVDDVRPFIESAHVYVLPSYHEGLPRSVIEAMAMGRPVLTTDAVGCRETVDNGVNGFKVPVKSVDTLAEKMIWFIEHSDCLAKMGMASRHLAEEKFDVNKVNAQMLTILEV